MTEEEVKEIYYNEYVEQHIGTYTLKKKYNHNMYEEFKKYKLPIRSDVEKNKKYHCKDDYFEVIDTEEKAYWLGFLMADGFITIRGNGKKVGLTLNVNDYIHIEKFKQAIQSDKPISVYSVQSGYKVGTKYARIIICSTKMVDDLIKHGCVEHKSNILKPPIGVPVELERNWIRGYMDGNGSIAIHKSKYIDTYGIAFASTDEVLNWIMDILIRDNILSRRYPLVKRKPGQIVSSFTFGGNNLVKKYCDYIYQDSSIYLDRKHDRYNNLCQLILERDSRAVSKKNSV